MLYSNQCILHYVPHQTAVLIDPPYSYQDLQIQLLQSPDLFLSVNLKVTC